MANLNLNKVILGGRITADIEQKATPNGVAVAQFTIAVNRRDKQTDFFNCVAWRKTAEFITQYFRKGSSICVVGSLQTRSYDGKDGNKRYVTEIIVDEANFVDSKSDGEQAQLTYTPEAYTANIDDDIPF